MLTNSRYISSLDSATSAYSSNRQQHETNWWLPDDEQRTKALIYGSTKVMYSLLFGDELCLPRNQAFDSPLFFNIFEGLKEVDRTWLNISVVSKTKPTPLSFVKDVAAQFSNPNFLLSAWPSLDQEQRNCISTNIIRTNNFKEMLNGIGDFPKPYDEIFLRQHVLLQHVLEYLYNHADALQKSDVAKKTLWDRLLDKNIQKQLGANAEILKTIPNRINKTENINNRGVLYNYIAEYTDARDQIREVIDQQYHYILAESISKGRIDISGGLFSKNTAPMQAKQIQAGDAQYDVSGLKSTYIQSIENNDGRNASSLNWNDITTVINDDDFQMRLAQLRLDLSNNKGEQVLELHKNHMDYLATFIPNKIITRTDSTSLTFGCLHLDTKENERFVNITSSFFGFLSGVIEEEARARFDSIIEANLENDRSTLAGRIRDWLQPLIEDKVNLPTNDEKIP